MSRIDEKTKMGVNAAKMKKEQDKQDRRNGGKIGKIKEERDFLSNLSCLNF
jgi:hypothetical protein